MKKFKVYIASAYTKGDVAVNVRVQLKAVGDLIQLGFVPFAPLLSHFSHMFTPQPYETWLEQDFEWIPVCDFLLRLPGKSKGADREIKLAKKLNIPVVYSIAELIAEAKKCS